VDPNIEELEKAIRDNKMQFADNLFLFLMNVIKFKFPDAPIDKKS